MYCYRITKYNPNLRDASGAYKKDEWIFYSDIGIQMVIMKILFQVDELEVKNEKCKRNYFAL